MVEKLIKPYKELTQLQGLHKIKVEHSGNIEFVWCSMGSGKSWFLCAEAIKNAMIFEGDRLVIIRKELSVLRGTKLVSFFS